LRTTGNSSAAAGTTGTVGRMLPVPFAAATTAATVPRMLLVLFASRGTAATALGGLVFVVALH